MTIVICFYHLEIKTNNNIGVRRSHRLDLQEPDGGRVPAVGRLGPEEGGHGGQEEAPPIDQCPSQSTLRPSRLPGLWTFLQV